MKIINPKLPDIANIAIFRVNNGWIVKVIDKIPVMQPYDPHADHVLERLKGNTTEIPKEIQMKDETTWVFTRFADVLEFLQKEIIKQSNT